MKMIFKKTEFLFEKESDIDIILKELLLYWRNRHI